MKALSSKMKLAALLMVTCGVVSNAFADDVLVRVENNNPNMLVFNAGDLINGVITLEYERALSPWFGLTGGFSVFAFRGVFTPQSQSSLIALGPEVGARFHFIRDAPAGLWVGPYLTGLYVTSRDGSVVVRNFGYNLGIAFGYNFVIARHFVISVGAGGGLRDFGGPIVWDPRFRLALGGVF